MRAAPSADASPITDANKGAAIVALVRRVLVSSRLQDRLPRCAAHSRIVTLVPRMLWRVEMLAC